MNRRDFLKSIGGLLAAAVQEPLQIFVPPRAPFVQVAQPDLHAHLGISRRPDVLCGISDRLLEVGEWDGIGYPCVVESLSGYSRPRPYAWVYDFDLVNFRLLDELGPLWKIPQRKCFNSLHAWTAFQRFGDDAVRLAAEGGGWLGKSGQLTPAIIARAKETPILQAA